jgi:hypothetical protein
MRRTTCNVIPRVPSERSRFYVIRRLCPSLLIQLIVAFVDMLNAMRFGRLDLKTTEAFKALSRKVIYTDGIEPTELCVPGFNHR